MEKIVIVDDDITFREKCKKMMVSNVGNNASVYCTGFSEMNTFNILKTDPNLMLIDMGNGDLCEKIVFSILNTHMTKPKIVLMSSITQLNEAKVMKFLKRGVQGYLSKEMSLFSFLNAIHIVQQGEMFVHDQVIRYLINEFKHLSTETFPLLSQVEPNEILTPREYQVFKCMARGYSNEEIGQQLHISKLTVKNHVSSILRKIQADNRLEAVIIGIKYGWL